MKIHKTLVIGIKMNSTQIQLFNSIIKNLRLVWNKAIELQKYVYKESGGYLSYRDLEYFMNHYLDYDYIKESKALPRQHLLMSLDDAYKRFFKGQSRYPRFKSYRNPVRSIYLHNMYSTSIRKISDNIIKVPYFGDIETCKPLPDLHNIISGRMVIRPNGSIFLHILVEEEISNDILQIETSPIGIDMGVRKLVTFNRQIVDTSEIGLDHHIQSFPKLSDINNHIAHYENRIRRLQRAQCRKYKIHKNIYGDELVELTQKKGKIPYDEYKKLEFQLWLKIYHSKNIDNLQKKINMCYQHITDIRKDYERKIVKSIINNRPRYIVIEDIDIMEMMRKAPSKTIRRSILNSRWYSFREWLTYKCKEYGIELRVARRDFESSQICSHCGYIHKDLKIKDRVYICPKCGYTEDRDINAAINLVNTKKFKIA